MFKKSPTQRGALLAKLLSKGDFTWEERKNIDKLFKAGPVIIPASSGDSHILTHAMYHDHQPVIHACIEQRADLDVQGRYNKYALERAIEKRQGELARRLINAGADVHIKSRFFSHSMLMLALEEGDLVTARALMKKGVSMQEVTKDGYGCLNAAVASGDPKVLAFALQHKAPRDVIYNGGDVIYQAVANNDIRMLDALLAAGFKIKFSARTGPQKGILQRAKKKSDNMYQHLLKLKEQAPFDEVKPTSPKKTPWKLTGPHEVAMAHPATVLPYQVTEIFNFQTGTYTRINRNVRTKAESAAMLDFNQMSRREIVEQAARELISLGGEMPEGQPLATSRTLITKPAAKDAPACS